MSLNCCWRKTKGDLNNCFKSLTRLWIGGSDVRHQLNIFPSSKCPQTLCGWFSPALEVPVFISPETHSRSVRLSIHLSLELEVRTNGAIPLRYPYDFRASHRRLCFTLNWHWWCLPRGCLLGGLRKGWILLRRWIVCDITERWLAVTYRPFGRTGQLMLYREIIVVCSEIHKNVNTMCGQNVEFLNLKTGGTYSNHCDIEAQEVFSSWCIM